MRTKYLLYSFFLLAIWPHQAMAQSLKGVVLDENSRRSLAGATVRLMENDQARATDIFGRFQFTELPAGNYTLEVSFIGYEKVSQSVTVGAVNETLPIFMKASILQLADITIQAEDQSQINIISAVDMQLRPVLSSQEVLRMVPGLFIAQHAGGGKAEQIFLRGFDIDHGTDIDLSVDGLPVNMVSHAHGQGYSDLHFLIPETIEQVNFQKGPYDAARGNFATAGFVDFQTRNALSQNLLKAEGGQFGTYRFVGMFDVLGQKAKEERQNAYVAAEYYATQNYFDSPQNFNRLNIFGKYHHYLGNNKIVSVSASAFRSQWDASGQIPERAVENGQIGFFGAIDDTEGGQTDRSNLNLQLTHLLPNGGYLQNQVFWVNYNFELYSNFTFFLNDPLNGDQIRQRENRQIYGYRGRYGRDFRLGKVNLALQAGGSLRYDRVRNNELSRTVGRQTLTEALALGHVDETNAAAFAEAQWQFGSRLSLTTGLRFDYFKFEYLDLLPLNYNRQFEEEQVLSPKLQFAWDASQKIRFYLKAGQGFHSNDTRVVVAQNGASSILPRAWGADLGLVLKPLPRMLVQLAVWHLDLEQEFVYVGDEAVVEPSGKTRRQGLDLSVRHQLTDWLFLDLDLSLAQPKAREAPEGEDFIPLAPTFTSVGGLSFRFKSGINGSLRYRYLDDRAANEDKSVVAEGYFLLDAVLNYTRPRYEIGLSLVNLTDSRWKEAQFDTESRLANELESVSEIHFTPGSPFFAKVSLSYFF
ncbi:MAG: TonB-dependent receptor [Microscillaceae bacterium]|nr:TonB-dependent receptor [Microscillaceae bacterium]